MPGYDKNTRDLESLMARVYLKLALLRRIREKLPTCKEKIINSVVGLKFRTFRQLVQAGTSICKPTALR